MNGQLNTCEVRPRVHEVREADRDGRGADEAVQDCDELGHLRHLHAPGRQETDAAAYQQRNDEQVVILRYLAEYRREQRNRHASDAVPVATTSGFLVGEAAEREDEQNRRDDVGDRNDALWQCE